MGAAQESTIRNSFSSNGSEWQVEAKLSNFTLMRNILTREVGEGYPLDLDQTPMYHLRTMPIQFLVGIHAITKNHIIFQRIPRRLNQINKLSYTQALYVIKSVLQASKIIQNHFHNFQYGQQIIGFNEQGLCKMGLKFSQDKEQIQFKIKNIMKMIQKKIQNKHHYGEQLQKSSLKNYEDGIHFVQKLMKEFPQMQMKIQFNNQTNYIENNNLIDNNINNIKKNQHDKKQCQEQQMVVKNKPKNALRFQQYNLPFTYGLPPKSKSRTKSSTNKMNYSQEKKKTIQKKNVKVQQKISQTFRPQRFNNFILKKTEVYAQEEKIKIIQNSNIAKTKKQASLKPIFFQYNNITNQPLNINKIENNIQQQKVYQKKQFYQNKLQKNIVIIKDLKPNIKISFVQNGQKQINQVLIQQKITQNKLIIENKKPVYFVSKKQLNQKINFQSQFVQAALKNNRTNNEKKSNQFMNEKPLPKQYLVPKIIFKKPKKQIQ